MTIALAIPVRPDAVKLTDTPVSFGDSSGMEWPARPPAVPLGDQTSSGPHITLETNEPGIRGLFGYRPETAVPLKLLSEVLLCGDSTLTRGERELIAAYVSALNRCRFCFYTHSAFAAVRSSDGMSVVELVCADLETAPLEDKLKALLRIAAAVQEGGKSVTARHVTDARDAGATDVEIHDTVLIAAAFCMYNRYVDGLATFAPDDPSVYLARAKMTDGYVSIPYGPQEGG
ncbi:carboxymuconolactone decarboxylase family protein [Sphaerisporangium fuscum]|uniref:carboxymuconolactone decarboxylase family protein n=1 Tax=Sphaerisporangium fuscum TaxID=2835868 RepID=UPI00202996D1|nr:carboxymuconolactone decarboxylase family protein [Sphaerisporangium fuscum]